MNADQWNRLVDILHLHGWHGRADAQYSEIQKALPMIRDLLVEADKPIVVVNGDGECVQIQHRGEVIWEPAKPTAPHLRRRIAELEQLLAEAGITCHLPGTP